MTERFVRLGLSLAVIGIISILFYQFSSRQSGSVAPPMTMGVR